MTNLIDYIENHPHVDIDIVGRETAEIWCSTQVQRVGSSS